MKPINEEFYEEHPKPGVPVIQVPNKVRLEEAIARMEGFYVKGSRAQRNNNPGNIEYGKFAKAHGSIGIEPQGLLSKGETPRFAVFNSSHDGFSALRSLLVIYSSNGVKTIEEAINKWAPPHENDTNQYVSNICKWVGGHPKDLFEDYI
jgi:hypothetical protein